MDLLDEHAFLEQQQFEGIWVYGMEYGQGIVLHHPLLWLNHLLLCAKTSVLNKSIHAIAL